VKAERLSLKLHPEFSERWVQARIAEDPAILGLGPLLLRASERTLPRAGRLDLLLQDPETRKRFEVELQLGATDEAHIIRCIEYWDIERRRYPQYEHCAVLVAEDITSRFLNVVSLFNGAIPLVALQLQAVRVNGAVSLVFTRVLDEFARGVVDEDEEAESAPADRAYWEQRAAPATMAIVDQLIEMAQLIDPRVTATFMKIYIGMARDGRGFNFVAFKPRKKWTTLEIKVPESDEVEAMIRGAGLDVGAYHQGFRYYPITLTAEDLANRRDAILALMRLAHQNREG
jgi:predicted transport protein